MRGILVLQTTAEEKEESFHVSHVVIPRRHPFCLENHLHFQVPVIWRKQATQADFPPLRLVAIGRRGRGKEKGTKGTYVFEAWALVVLV